MQAQWCIVQVSMAVSETTKHGSAGPDAGGTCISLFLRFSSALSPVFLSFFDFASGSALRFSSTLTPDRLPSASDRLSCLSDVTHLGESYGSYVV